MGNQRWVLNIVKVEVVKVKVEVVKQWTRRRGGFMATETGIVMNEEDTWSIKELQISG